MGLVLVQCSLVGLLKPCFDFGPGLHTADAIIKSLLLLLDAIVKTYVGAYVIVCLC